MIISWYRCLQKFSFYFIYNWHTVGVDNNTMVISTQVFIYQCKYDIEQSEPTSRWYINLSIAYTTILFSKKQYEFYRRSQIFPNNKFSFFFIFRKNINESNSSCREANALDFILRLPDKLDTMVRLLLKQILPQSAGYKCKNILTFLLSCLLCKGWRERRSTVWRPEAADCYSTRSGAQSRNSPPGRGNLCPRQWEWGRSSGPHNNTWGRSHERS